MKKLYTVLLAIIPIFSAYSSGISGFSISDILLIILLGMGLLQSSSRKERSEFHTSGHNLRLVVFLSFIAYLSVVSLISCLTFPQYESDIIVRTIRLCFYIIVCLNLSPRLFDKVYFVKVVNLISLICFVCIVLQYITYSFWGLKLSMHISVLSLNTDSYYDALEKSWMFRPSAFFMEPSIMVWYMFPVLLYDLFWNKNKSKYVNGIIISTAILLSKSLFGIAIVFAIWGAFALKPILLKQGFTIKSFLMVLVIAVSFYLLLNNKIVGEALLRLDIDNLSGSASFSGRFLKYQIFKDGNIFQKIFGIGIGNNLGGTDSLSNTFAYILTGSGIIGAGLYSFLVGSMLKKAAGYSAKLFVLLVFLISFGSNIFLGSSLVFFAGWWYALNEKSSNPIPENRSRIYGRRIHEY